MCPLRLHEAPQQRPLLPSSAGSVRLYQSPAQGGTAYASHALPFSALRALCIRAVPYTVKHVEGLLKRLVAGSA